MKNYPDQFQNIVIKISEVFQKKIVDNTADNLSDQVIPQNGVTIPIVIGGLGERMIQSGVIDKDKIDNLYVQRGLIGEMDQILFGNNPSIIINKNNSNLFLNFFWALGLGNKNSILIQGHMVQNGKTANFASTGGWTLAQGQTMDHYSKYDFVTLNPAQQNMVVNISKNIYRPCCNNSTFFPDCNHGMAMLGFIELMASRDFSENEIYKNALILNSFWFSNDYLTIAQYLRENGQEWNKVDPKTILGQNISSSRGIAKIRSKVKKLPFTSEGGGCSV